jgi:hypothetical protein
MGSLFAKPTHNNSDLLNIDALAGIQYLGVSGVSKDCYDAFVIVLQSYHVSQMIVLTTKEAHTSNHALLMHSSIGDICIKDGFASGYVGEGPYWFDKVIKLALIAQIDIDEAQISGNVLKRVKESCLICDDIDYISLTKRGCRLGDYILSYESNYSLDSTTITSTRLPLCNINQALLPLAFTFNVDPVSAIMKANTLLEDKLREHVDTNRKEEVGSKLAAEFCKDGSCDDTLTKGGAYMLFQAYFKLYRNAIMHRNVQENNDMIFEFLYVNKLFNLIEQKKTIS